MKVSLRVIVESKSVLATSKESRVHRDLSPKSKRAAQDQLGEPIFRPDKRPFVLVLELGPLVNFFL